MLSFARLLKDLANLSAHKIQQWCADFYVSIGNYTNRYLEFLRIYAKKFTSLLSICVFAQIIQSLTTLSSKITIRNSAHVRKNFHVSFKIWRICQRTKSKNNDAQNTSTYLKGIIQMVINLGVSAHVRKKLPRLY